MTGFMFVMLSNMLISGEELRFSHVFKQGYDTSCGVSVTASLLHKYWNIPVLEGDLYQDMILDRVEGDAGTYTINFVTIGDYIKRHGIQSRAYKMDWETLEETLAKGFGPLIINYETPQAHFALLLHIEQNYAVVADPAKGLEIIHRLKFMRHYSGNVLVTASRTQHKDEAYTNQVIAEEQHRLTRLQRLARLQGRR